MAADPNKEARLRFESLSRQHVSSDVEEVRGKTCERLLAVARDREGTLLIFYLRVDVSGRPYIVRGFNFEVV